MDDGCMLVPLTWSDVTFRLALTVLASGLFGVNRSEEGHAAGLRTTMLLGLAAAVAMIECNWLLHTSGRGADSFVSIDPMRLPLGVLSGIGFIGAGAILRRGERIAGVTTAATLWFVTILGLCFGAGMVVIGIIATLLGLGILVGLKLLDRRMPQARHALLTLRWKGDALSESDVRTTLTQAGFTIRNVSLTCSGERWKLSLRLRWRVPKADLSVPDVVKSIGQRAEVSTFDWKT